MSFSLDPDSPEISESDYATFQLVRQWCQDGTIQEYSEVQAMLEMHHQGSSSSTPAEPAVAPPEELKIDESPPSDTSAVTIIQGVAHQSAQQSLSDIAQTSVLYRQQSVAAFDAFYMDALHQMVNSGELERLTVTVPPAEGHQRLGEKNLLAQAQAIIAQQTPHKVLSGSSVDSST